MRSQQASIASTAEIFDAAVVGAPAAVGEVRVPGEAQLPGARPGRDDAGGQAARRKAVVVASDQHARCWIERCVGPAPAARGWVTRAENLDQMVGATDAYCSSLHSLAVNATARCAEENARIRMISTRL